MEVKEISRDKVQLDALDIAINNERVTLGISMGVGKTRIAINHLIKLYDPFIRVLVVVPKWSVRDSWIDELGLFSSDPFRRLVSTEAGVRASLLCAYRKFPEITKTSKFALSFKWTIIF